MDERHIKDYVKASAGDERFAAYLKRYVYIPASHASCLDALGGS